MGIVGQQASLPTAAVGRRPWSATSLFPRRWLNADDKAELERLAAVELCVPPLRERGRDIPLLLDHFLARAARRLGKSLRGFSDDALERLVDYHWPGNVRELESVIERAVILARAEQITSDELPERLESEPTPREGDLGLRRGRKRLEAELIRRALRRTGGNRTRAARLLEISHRALLYKLKEYGIGKHP